MMKGKSSKPSLGFSPKPEHAYLGHFKEEKNLRMGHNYSRPPRSPRFSMVGSNIVSTVGNRTRTMGAPLGAQVVNRLGRQAAARDIRAGSSVVAAERPVLAAKLAARAAGVTGAERRSMVQAARQDPDSARSERRQRRTMR